MFNWFKTPDYKLPAPVPYIDAPESKSLEKDPVTFYSIGPTDDNRISLRIGYSTITMNKVATQAMIDLLTTAMTNLTVEDEAE